MDVDEALKLWREGKIIILGLPPAESALKATFHK